MVFIGRHFAVRKSARRAAAMSWMRMVSWMRIGPDEPPAPVPPTYLVLVPVHARRRKEGGSLYI